MMAVGTTDNLKWKRLVWGGEFQTLLSTRDAIGNNACKCRWRRGGSFRRLVTYLTSGAEAEHFAAISAAWLHDTTAETRLHRLGIIFPFLTWQLIRQRVRHLINRFTSVYEASLTCASLPSFILVAATHNKAALPYSLYGISTYHRVRLNDTSSFPHHRSRCRSFLCWCAAELGLMRKKTELLYLNSLGKQFESFIEMEQNAFSGVC